MRDRITCELIFTLRMTMTRIDCFIPYEEMEATRRTVEYLIESPLVNNIYLLTNDPHAKAIYPCFLIRTENLWSTHTMWQIAQASRSDYSLVCTRGDVLQPGLFALERLAAIADDTAAGMVYSDYYEMKDGVRTLYPVTDYQVGSLRDDFNFGPVQMYRSLLMREALLGVKEEYLFAGLYDMRLKVSERSELVHVNEYLYSVERSGDGRRSGEKIFDYVDPKNRAVQVEMEAACTHHLKAIGAYLPPRTEGMDFDACPFDVEASVIIPVRNRVRTIDAAIRSVLEQQTSFRFNLLVVDNHSTDGTTEKIASFADDPRLVHIRPQRSDLGIGGCWNVGVHHPSCGRFVVQLDSDDVYSSPHTLQKVVDAFYSQQCAMVVGTYMMTDFNLNQIAPGVIDHREWTPENGHNNALRINGLGAPRAFYTPVLRNLNLPNTSYGEDYALGLRISRDYRIGRIYDVLYLCRRWEDNSDAALDVVKMNTYNTYKDKIRTWELQARLNLVSE